MRNVLLGLAISLSLTACTTSSTSTLSVDNQSDFLITELYLTDVGSSSWGPNLLSGDTLNPGETLQLDVGCSNYDAKLIDETGVSCEVDDLDLCLNDALWIIHNDTCTAFNAAAQARKNGTAAKQ